ncbi:MAG: exosortase system-associated protein, TIGR04073 family [Candidatus Omnitrophica bacterium]|nr:exosortase system-associated protein, TIGR04073 family [Candidatus Omnitrophota bacterium]MBI2495080.1 exosortase system-associated protein, TIGR04073 family [Candidatus Omnitrophota bacterium]MBI3020563.1 exosortase system-associated protein, TIGR04073 family [Candidatus Omnitrophota bacterium]
MRKIAVVGWLLAALVLLVSVPRASAESMDSGKAFTKFTRGFVNIVTGWVEIPKRIQETSQASGAFAGFTWGVLRGIGYGFIRTAAGGYELVTFPFPAPPGYEPVIQPEYVFSERSTHSSADN